MDPPPSGSTLTAEQLDRIAQNKKRAQELRKRKHPPNNFPNPPVGTGKNTLELPLSKRSFNYTSFPTSVHSSRSLDVPDDHQFGSSQFPNPQSDNPLLYSAPLATSQSALTSHHSTVQQNASYKMQSSCPKLCLIPSVNDKTNAGGSASAELTAASSGRQKQVLKFKDLITANFVILSRSRFKVQMPYDAEVIEMFKRMKTKSYGKIWQCIEIHTFIAL